DHHGQEDIVLLELEKRIRVVQQDVGIQDEQFALGGRQAPLFGGSACLRDRRGDGGGDFFWFLGGRLGGRLDSGRFEGRRIRLPGGFCGGRCLACRPGYSCLGRGGSGRFWVHDGNRGAHACWQLG